MDFWRLLQANGYNLESLYSALEVDLKGDLRVLLEDFEAIVRTAVSAPLGERGVESTCPHHRRLCEALEPGDYIIDFNWDPVMADTLLYHSHLWFPWSGFGVAGVSALLPNCQKALRIPSQVELLQVHGSVVLFDLDAPETPDRRAILYLGPRQYSAITGLLALRDMTIDQLAPGSHALEAPSELEASEERIGGHGHIYLKGNWFKPLFIPPSRSKPQYGHWFFEILRRKIHSYLPLTDQLIIAGYSFPETDLGYLGEIFVPGVMQRKMEIEIVNPENDSEDFRQRVHRVFPNVADIRFGQGDFRKFCAEIDIDYPDRPSLRVSKDKDEEPPA